MSWYPEAFIPPSAPDPVKVARYHSLYNMVETTIRFKESNTFFRDGAARRATLAGLEVMEEGQDAIIDAVADSLNRDSHVCLFDDPCDAWAA
jgi:hypothetical protein